MPRLRTKNMLVKAIEGSHIIRITYKGLIYEVEGYLVWANKRGKQYLHAWKRSGGWLKEEGCHWANFIVREITSVEIIGTYRYPLWGYKPKSKMFYRKIFEWRYKK